VESPPRESRRGQTRRRVQTGPAPAERHGLAPEAIAGRVAEPVAREQFHDGRCAAETPPFEVGLQLDDGGVGREPPLDLSFQRVRHFHNRRKMILDASLSAGSGSCYPGSTPGSSVSFWCGR
jgi:hypothetical protein